jgi:hypothetical protein
MEPRPPKPLKTPRRRRWLGVVACLGVLSALVLALTVEGGRRWAEREASDQLRAKAAARGWDVSWDKLSLGYDLRLGLRGLSAQGPGGSTFTLDAADLAWEPRALLAGHRLPDRVHARGLRAHLDADALRALSPSGGGAAQAPSVAGPWPSVTLEDARLDVPGLPVIGDLSLEGARLDAAHTQEGWRLQAQARCAEGCGEPQGLRAELTRAPNGDLRAWVEPARPITLPLDHEGLQAQVSARRVSAEREGGRLSVGLGEVEVEEVRAFGWQARLSAQEVLARFDSLDELRAKRPSGLALRGPDLTASPLAQGAARAEEPSALPEDGQGDKLRKAERLQATLKAALPMLRLLRVEQGALHLPAHGLDLTAVEAGPTQGGGWRAGGGLAQGRAYVELSAQEDGLIVELDAVRLSDLAQHPLAAPRLEAISHLRGLDGVLGAKLRLAVTPRNAEGQGQELRLAGRLTLDEGFLDVDGLTPVPVEHQRLTVQLDVAARPSPGPGFRVELREVTLSLPSRASSQPAQAHLVGWVDRLHPARRPAFNLALQVEEGPCALTVGAIPDAFVSHLKDHLTVEGRFAPIVTAALDLEDPRTLELDVTGFPGTCHVTDLGPYSPDFLADRFKLEVREGVTREGIFVGPSRRASFVRRKGACPELRRGGGVPERGRSTSTTTQGSRHQRSSGSAIAAQPGKAGATSTVGRRCRSSW